MDYTPLAAELTLPAYAKFSDADAAVLLNAPVDAGTRTVPMRVGDLANWLAGRGLLRKVNAAKDHADDTVASVGLLLMFKLQGQPDAVVDPADPATAGLFAVLVGAKVVGDRDVSDFAVACTAAVTTTRARQIGWTVPPTADDVTHARSLK